MTNDKLRRAQLMADLRSHPDSSTREIGERVELTRRQVVRLVGELERDGLVKRQPRVGTTNHYEVGPPPGPRIWPEEGCF
jgi:DNA-binding IclR family transcriptional regulator